MVEYSKDYTPSEFQAVMTSREIEDGQVIFVGVGMPLLGALLASITHAPNLIIATESGAVGPKPLRLMLGAGDNANVENSICNFSLWRLFTDMQAGFIDLGAVGGAQVDKYGNLNSTGIFGDNEYPYFKSRLPGSGGASDIASSARHTIITMPLGKRRFVEKVDFNTSPGHLNGGDSRQKAGLPGGGPAAIISDGGIFRFDPATKEAYLDGIREGVTIDEIRAQVAWDLKVASEVKVLEPPTVKQIEIIRGLDPYHIFSGGLADLTFDKYIQMLNDSYEAMPKIYASLAD
jgi:Acyl CoA:acetate/3-ketoacid CoA transferase, beta subunit